MRFEQAKALLAAFDRHDVQYVLVGSMAMAAQGLVRATRDIDFFVAPDDENVERIKQALRSVFDDESIDDISAADLAGEYPVIQYGPPDADYVIDLLSRLGETFAFSDIESEEFDLEGVRITVATPLMLYRMKRATVRPQDRVDAEALKERFELRDESEGR
jgi:hypothetical protein